MPDEEKHDSKAEEKHEGISTKIRERLHEAKERANPVSQTNKEIRREKHERQAELSKAQREAYEKEEIKQAAESGKKAAQKRFAPREQHHEARHVASQAGKFARGASTGFGAGIFGRGTSGYYDMSFGPFAAPKKKPKPERVTTVNPRTGKVTIRETLPEEKKKEAHESWNSFEMLTVPEIHTQHSNNPFNIEIAKPHPTRKGKGKRKAPKKKWQLGDLY